MVNCTAAQRLDTTRVVYGDYMDSIESQFLNEGGDLTAAKLKIWSIRALGTLFVGWK